MGCMPAFPDFTVADLEQLAGRKSFERGLDYLDMVTHLTVIPAGVTATVRGSYDYAVFLATGPGQLGGDCSCPYGQEGNFCKHCVAVGLAALQAGQSLPKLAEAAQASRTAVDRWLESLSQDELLAELRGLLDDDPELCRQFELRAAVTSADAAAVRQVVIDLVVVEDYISYQEAAQYANGVRVAAAAISSLIEAGAGEAAIDIARAAIGLLNHAFSYIDDSSGVTGDAAQELLSVHLDACLAAPPEPASLGDYLASLLLDDDHGLEPSLDDYADLLGEVGFGRLRDRIRAAYAADPQAWRPRWLMETLLRAEGDVDGIVALLGGQLDERGWNHLRIAQELDQAGRVSEALGWAERGIRDAKYPDPRLTEYLAGRYASDDRQDDLLALRRTRFQAERSLANYQSLHQVAESTGTWAAERGQALSLLTADARSARHRPGLPWAAGPVLIDVLLDEDELDEAWAAADGVASQEQWLRLADAVAASRPADALAVYLQAVEPLRAQTGNEVYERVATLLLAARGCHQALGTMADFDRYLALLRADQKRKRNLMKILDKNGLHVGR
jgi:uncharacterized Zn finger protein